jgi:hypothetical protein
MTWELPLALRGHERKHKGAHQETLNLVLDTLVQAAEQVYGQDACAQKYAAVVEAAT